MNYTVISGSEVCGKFKGNSLTEKELTFAGANIDALIEAGHIAPVSSTAKTPALDQGEK